MTNIDPDNKTLHSNTIPGFYVGLFTLTDSLNYGLYSLLLFISFIHLICGLSSTGAFTIRFYIQKSKNA